MSELRVDLHDLHSGVMRIGLSLSDDLQLRSYQDTLMEQAGLDINHTLTLKPTNSTATAPATVQGITDLHKVPTTVSPLLPAVLSPHASPCRHVG